MVLESGSMQIHNQKRILDIIDGDASCCSQLSDITVQRELVGYGFTDTIAMPARHVEAVAFRKDDTSWRPI